MVTIVLTCFRGKYIDFQLKMLFGKRVSVFLRGVHPYAWVPVNVGSFSDGLLWNLYRFGPW